MTTNNKQEALEACDTIQHILSNCIKDVSDRNCLIANIEYIRTSLVEQQKTNAELQDFACRISDVVWGGELGWLRVGLNVLADEVKKRIYGPDVNQELLEAAKQVVSRWHTPLWKDVPATGFFINILEKAISNAVIKGQQNDQN